MSKLTSRGRNRLPSSDFAEPAKRKYPIQDLAHARNALSRVAQFGDAADKAAVRRAVARKYPALAKRSKS